MNKIKEIYIPDFGLNRAGKSLKWRLAPSVNILTGENGAGKSRLLAYLSQPDKAPVQVQLSAVRPDFPVRAALFQGVEYGVGRVLDDLANDAAATLTGLLLPGEMEVFANEINLLIPKEHHCGKLAVQNGSLVFTGQGRLGGGLSRLFGLSVFLYQNRETDVFLLDDMETGLHVNIQAHLISALLRLFPHHQFIITTHSPGIIMNGWNDAYISMDEILFPNGGVENE